MKSICIINQTEKIGKADLLKIVDSIQYQISNDFATVWAIDAKLKIGNPAKGDYLVFLKDQLSQKGLDGFHYVENNIPIAEVKYSKNWSYTASHEILEMLVNPFIVETDENDSIFVMKEVADATNKKGYKINGVEVSNFVTPDYYNAVHIEGKIYDFMGLLKRPLEIYEGGYMSWFDANNQYYQAIKANGRIIVKNITGSYETTQNPILWLLAGLVFLVLMLISKK